MASTPPTRAGAPRDRCSHADHGGPTRHTRPRCDCGAFLVLRHRDPDVGRRLRDRLRAIDSRRMMHALDLWFAGHLPYSLWLLIAFACMGAAANGPLRLLITSAIIPAVWTACIVAAFCRVVLGTSPSGARWRA